VQEFTIHFHYHAKMGDSQYLLSKKELSALLEVSVSGLRTWRDEGAPLGADLSGDPVAVAQWYVYESRCSACSGWRCAGGMHIPT
jgi:hypothetical protein